MTNGLYCGWRRFCWPWWRHWLSPRTYWKAWLWRDQRAWRGWADCDTWDLGMYLAEVLPPALERMRDNSDGYPSELTPDEWRAKLTAMAEGFRAATALHELPDRFFDADSHLIDDVGLRAWQAESEQVRLVGFAEFTKWFGHLWD